MNAPVKITPVEAYRQQVLPPEKATDLWRSLPAHIKPALFERNLVNALMNNPDLMTFAPPLIYREVSKAAGLGLLLDPLLGEAYIVPAWNGKTKRVEPQLRVGYKGMCKLARQTGDVTNIYAHEACQHDSFRCQLGTDKRIDHEPNMMTDRGAVALYYAVIKFKDGTFDFDVMTVRDCQGIRDRSDAWKAFRENKIKSTPWSTDEIEMSKKTVLRRLLKRQPQSPELAEAIKIEDEADFPEFRASRRAVEDEPPAPPPNPAIGHRPAVEMEIISPPIDDPAPVERTMADLVEPGIPEFLRRTEPAKPAANARPNPTEDPEWFFKWVEDQMAPITEYEAAETLWNDQIAPLVDQLFPPDAEHCLGIWRKHERRLSP